MPLVSSLEIKPPLQLEWTTVKPIADAYVNSPLFNLWDGQFSLRLYGGEPYDLLLHIVKQPTVFLPLMFDTSVCIVKGSETYIWQNSNVTEKQGRIWRESVNYVSKTVPDFYTTRLVKFGISIFLPSDDGHLARKTDDRMVIQRLSSLDNHFDLEALSSDFANLLDGGLHHDVEIICGDRTFKVHKNVLSARSEVFAAMLHSSMAEGQTGRVTVEDIDSDDFEQFLRYLYSGVLPVLTETSAVRLYAAADKYAVGALKKQCVKSMTETLTHENACAMLILADQYGDADLRESVVLYIMDQEIPLRDELWEEFCEHYPKLSIEVLRRFCKLKCSR